MIAFGVVLVLALGGLAAASVTIAPDVTLDSSGTPKPDESGAKASTTEKTTTTP